MKSLILVSQFLLGGKPCALAFQGVLLGALGLSLMIPDSITAANLLGTTNLIVGPAAGWGSVVLNNTNSWTSTANDGWLHLDPTYQSGSNSLNVIFSFDANTNAAQRTGSLSISDGTVTITQAGTNYVAAYANNNTFDGLPQVASGVTTSMAVDSRGNLVFIDNNLSIKIWNATNGTVTPLVSTNLNNANGLALDAAGNIYIADSGDHSIKVWSPVSHSLTTLIASGLVTPEGLAVDGDGNLYIADYGANVIKKWSAADQTLTNLVDGLSKPTCVAVDNAGNVYIADNNYWIKFWSPVNGLSNLPNTDNLSPLSLTVDGSGNVYSAEIIGSSIIKWSAVDHSLNAAVIIDSLLYPECVALDNVGNLFCADLNGNIRELPQAFIDPTFKIESTTVGSDSLPPVLPSGVNLTGPCAPTSQDSWLTINNSTAGVVTFSFTAGANRMSSIQIFDQSIPVLQGISSAPPVTLTTDALGNLILSGTDGPANGTFTCVSSTNLTAPLASWQVVSNGVFYVDGSFSFTNAANASLPGNFYTIRIP